MRKKSLLIFLISGFFFGLGAFAWIALPKEKEIARFERLAKKGRFGSYEEEVGEQRQKRKGVRKDFYFFENGQRHHAVITSNASSLFLVPDEREFGLEERMKGVFGLMQEKVLEEGNEQLVRQFIAKKGTFNYQAKTFRAKNAELKRFFASGDLLDFNTDSLRLLMEGRAREIELSFDHGMSFKANKAKMRLIDTGGRR